MSGDPKGHGLVSHSEKIKHLVLIGPKPPSIQPFHGPLCPNAKPLNDDKRLREDVMAHTDRSDDLLKNFCTQIQRVMLFQSSF